MKEDKFVYGRLGSGVCSEGTFITDETSCREACKTLNIPQAEIFGNYECYKDFRNGKCYQDGLLGWGGWDSLICKISDQISGQFIF